ncbi:SCO0930 family lipoprotein [Streptomyces neyagawaensis]|uniref:SCO0930 family lipoprotein n=1 Tax=Streptomyces neyagawaensis TaxID=42238 RepID=A0ABV3B8F2_9ACTN
MNTSWRSAALVASAAAVLALTTACGQEQGSTSSQNVGAASTPTLGAGTIAGAAGTAGAGAAGTDTSDQAQSTTAASAGQLTVWNSDEYGKVLTDSAGRTLYRFDKDSFEPPKTTCEGECATTWPPVPAAGATAAEGVDQALLGEITRPDGTKQLTVAGWPQYYFAKDTKAGDIKGQGLKGAWFASAPNGKKASTKGGGGAGAAGDAGGEAVGQAGLTTRNDPKLGEVVVDKNGMTVYRFLKDKQWPMSTKCTGACLDKWPVVAPVEKNDTKGILLKGYTVFDRPDGIKQQTINCIPLYTFAGDKAPGDTKGQGVGGTWFAINGDGEPIGAQ